MNWSSPAESQLLRGALFRWGRTHIDKLVLKNIISKKDINELYYLGKSESLFKKLKYYFEKQGYKAITISFDENSGKGYYNLGEVFVKNQGGIVIWSKIIDIGDIPIDS